MQATAEAVQAAEHREPDEPAPDPVAVLTRQTEAPAHDAVAEEARKGYDLLVLGAQTGLSKGYLSDIETGKRKGTLATLDAIAKSLRVKLDDLV